ncbi:hypothetical protein BWK47_04285 [Synechocystis sp. CACIAM 05]|nr:hypothetical protein BWK47_04285 [Synechocystis sp. CACIAM 05]
MPKGIDLAKVWWPRVTLAIQGLEAKMSVRIQTCKNLPKNKRVGARYNPWQGWDLSQWHSQPVAHQHSLILGKIPNPVLVDF